MSHCATQDAAKHCSACGELCQLQWELHREFGAPGIGFAFQCRNKHKWAHCVPCKKCFGCQSARHICDHLKSKAHQERCTEMFTATEMSTAKAPPEARPPTHITAVTTNRSPNSCPSSCPNSCVRNHAAGLFQTEFCSQVNKPTIAKEVQRSTEDPTEACKPMARNPS